MQPEHQQDIELFNEALTHESNEEREQFLSDACADDPNPNRLQRLRALPKAYEGSDSLFDGDDHTQLDPNPDLIEEAGSKVGPFKLLQKIGEGGMGVVYMADQELPVKRRVALKIIKVGMDTRQVVARFEAERQALAMMDHPNIARVFDGGCTESGRPYFAMELVQGVPITEFCDKNKLTLRERVDLFLPVCQAIQSAHQKGVIHRDIKPSNVLVTMEHGEPMAMVIDFGVAKAINQRLTEKTLFTNFATLIGTPAYMSPEQAEMSRLDVDTRSDIYSLGALLYELLTGTTPFDSKDLLSRGYGELQRVIAEDEPPRPSLRASTLEEQKKTAVSVSRHLEVANLEGALKGDLDWIVMKCLEKDRRRRYDTSKDLAHDLRRYLDHEPVSAAAPSLVYQLQKLYGRHQTVFHAAAVILFLLLAGIATTTWQAIRATKEAERAEVAEDLATQRLAESEESRKDAEAISDFLTGLFTSAQPGEEEGGRDVRVADILDRAVKKLETDLAEQPKQQAKLRATIGETYRALGLYPKAIELEEQVLEFHETTLGNEHPDTLEAMHTLANSYQKIKIGDKLNEAVNLKENILAIRRKNLGLEHTETIEAMNNLATAYFSIGHWTEAASIQEEVVALRRKMFGPDDPVTLLMMRNLASYYIEIGKVQDSLELHKEVLERRQKTLGQEHTETISSMVYLAYAYRKIGRLKETLELHQDVLALRRKVNGPEHPNTIFAMFHLVQSYRANGQHLKALEMGENCLALRRKALGPEHPDTIRAMAEMAVCYENVGQTNDALTMHKNVVALRRRVLDPEHRDTYGAFTNLIEFHLNAELHEEALALQQKELTAQRILLGGEHPRIIHSILLLARVHEAAGQFDEAIAHQKEAIVLSRKVFGDQDFRTLNYLRSLAITLSEAGRDDDALPVRKEVLAGRRVALGMEHSATLWAMHSLALLHEANSDFEEAIALLEEAVKTVPKVFASDESRQRNFFELYANLLSQSGRLAEARELRHRYGLSISIDSNAPRVRTVIIAAGSDWNWFHPTSGIDPAERDPDFHKTFFTQHYDDSTWQSGQDREDTSGGFGYGEEWFTGVDIGTPAGVRNRDGQLQGKTAYFRHRFTTTETHTHLELRCQRDDGIIVYLDGEEVARDNMNPGEEAYGLPALSAVGNKMETTTFRLPLSDVVLTPGEHLLAISLHNPSAPSSDLRIGGISLVEVTPTETHNADGSRSRPPESESY